MRTLIVSPGPALVTSGVSVMCGPETRLTTWMTVSLFPATSVAM
jgi:hypothetical protein